MKLDPKPENPCFGCGGANPRGMRLAFEQDDARQRIVGRFRLGFAGVSERDIARGIATLADVLRAEMRKRQRGARRAETPRVALV